MSAQRATYDQDVIAWALEQARLLRSGQFSALDIEHIADEIEDVGKAEKRELASRMAVLLTHLLKWQYQPAFRGRSWQQTIKHQRKSIALELKNTPSLKTLLRDTEWQELVWGDAVSQAFKETGLDTFPEICPWTTDQVLSPDWLPSE
jgi:hypothetical protein